MPIDLNIEHLIEYLKASHKCVSYIRYIIYLMLCNSFLQQKASTLCGNDLAAFL